MINKLENNTIFDAISAEEITAFKEQFNTYGNANQTLHAIAKHLFRKLGIRTLSQLDDGTEQGKNSIYYVQSVFFKAQEKSIISQKMRKEKTTNFENGERVVKEINIPEEIPIFNYKKSRDLQYLTSFLDNDEVSPDFDLIRQQMLPDDYEEGKNLIRKITKYFVFAEPEKFNERFSLLICNAKAKALGHKPKYPVLFSLVGDMGKGKGWFRDMIAKTYDEVFMTKSQAGSFRAILNTQFNSIMLTRGFVTLDERNGLDANQCEQLKHIITEPKIFVNEKYKTPKSVENYVTFFSCSNESVKDVMGLQKDRRIVEFNLLGKNDEMPEQELHDLLIQLWKIMPVDCPVQDKVISELLEESEEVLNNKMSDFVYTVFEDKDLFTNGQTIILSEFKKCIKVKDSGMSWKRVLDWCIKNKLVNDYRGHYRYSKKTFKKLESQHLELLKSDGYTEDFDEDDLLKI